MIHDLLYAFTGFIPLIKDAWHAIFGVSLLINSSMTIDSSRTIESTPADSSTIGNTP